MQTKGQILHARLSKTLSYLRLLSAELALQAFAQETNLLVYLCEMAQDLSVTESLPLMLASLQTVCYQRRTVQTEVLHVKAACFRQAQEHTVCLFSKMVTEIVVEGMQDAVQ
jgi:hypothetical protein